MVGLYNKRAQVDTFTEGTFWMGCPKTRVVKHYKTYIIPHALTEHTRTPKCERALMVLCFEHHKCKVRAALSELIGGSIVHQPSFSVTCSVSHSWRSWIQLRWGLEWCWSCYFWNQFSVPKIRKCNFEIFFLVCESAIVRWHCIRLNVCELLTHNGVVWLYLKPNTLCNGILS